MITAAAIGYLVGHRGHQVITTRTGVAYASPYQAVVRDPGGFYYAIPLERTGSIPKGTMHDGGRPACLPAFRESRIVFGTVDNPVLATRSVVWVRCPTP